MTKKVIAIFGATGAQGGGLARAILVDKNSDFVARAVTRKPDSDAAKVLGAAGAQIAVADMDDAASVERALEGAYGAFCVTNFWEHFSPDREIAQAKAMADGAAATGLKHVIWSTLEDTRAFFPIGSRMPVLMGKYNVPHFDAKGEANRFFTARVPTTLLLASFDWDDMVHFGSGPKKGKDGKLAITFPIGDKKMPGIAAEDIGKCAYGIFQKGTAMVGKTVGVTGEQPTGAQMAAALSKALGQPVAYNAVTPDQYRAFGLPGAEELGNMFQFYADFEDYCCGVRSVEGSRRLNPELQDLATFLARNSSRIPLD